MGRRKSEAYKRRRKKQRKKFVKALVKLAIPITIIITVGSHLKDSKLITKLINNFSNNDEVTIEQTLDDYEEIEKLDECLEDVQEVALSDEKEEVIEEEIALEPVDIINTDLIDMGYEFKTIDFDELTSVNEDCIGWISIDNTKVDYPLLQSKDNEDYLHQDINGKTSKSGSIFLDANNNSLLNQYNDLSDINFIYGHHMTGRRMFSDICKYKRQSFLDENPFFVIYTSDGYAYKADVFAGIIVKGDDYGIYNQNYSFDDVSDFDDYMAYLQEYSLISSDVSVEYNDKIVALVTCTYENGVNGNLRFVVFAKLSKQYTNELQYEHDAVYALR